MITETPADDPRLVWQGQNREHPIMSLEEVRIAAHTARSRARRNLIVAAISGALLLVFSAVLIVTLGSTPVRMIAAGMIVLALMLAAKSYGRVWMRHTLSPDAAMRGCVDFYRRELEAQYRSLRLTWQFLLPAVFFLFPAWNTIFETRGSVPRLLLPAVLVLIIVVLRREARKIRRKLAVLDASEMEHP